jgi:endonuclease YncB( thermonuclease family)
MILIATLLLTLTPGHVARVIDGDTFVLYHVGIPPEEHVRLLGVDCPELSTEAGRQVVRVTEEWLRRGPFQLRAERRDGFGRLLADVWRDSEHLGQELIRQGLCRVRR